ncbi:MAG: hypothetical protein JWQ04_2885 [Pedosphaera sp.]|nr:hypothetical protein [Pedosphaera sp.]
MRKEVFLEQFKRRAVELGYPERKLRRKVEELDLHHDFLKRTALKEHLSEEAAEARSSVELGNPVTLAEEAAAAQRQSSWWGRHPIIGYILLPILLLGPTLIGAIALMFVAGLLRMPKEQWNDYGSGVMNGGTSMKEIGLLIKTLFKLHYLLLTLLPIPFCWMARRSASGLLWVTVPCVICAVQGMCLQIIWPPHPRGIPLGYFMDPNWLGGLGPLMIAGANWLQRALALRRLAPLPENVKTKPSGFEVLIQILNTPMNEWRPELLSGAKSSPEKTSRVKRALRTPTYWVIAILISVLMLMAMVGRYKATHARPGVQTTGRARRNNNNQALNLATADWPAEREATIAEIRARQASKETHNETLVNLQSHINVQLDESVDGGTKELKDNHLLELPRGINIYGGVPFDVEGRVQLMGRGLEQWKRIFPVTARNIEIRRKCAKIHLFHGENCNMDAQERGAVARLILHYADDTQQTIEIISGEHLLDWCGAIYTTGVRPEQRVLSSPDAELAWVGQNAFTKRRHKDFSLRLYKSTFANPRPDVEITSVEYVSTMSQAAPFLLGMTVE